MFAHTFKGFKPASYLIALVTGAMLSLFVQAAETATWIDDPANRGTEAEPINLYNGAKWNIGVLPSSKYNIEFIADGRTYVTNTASAKIAMCLWFSGGDFVVFGPMNCDYFGYGFSETKPVSIDKRGDWVVRSQFYIATKDNAEFAFTNRTGNLEICKEPARIGNGKNSVASFVLESGSVTGVSSGKNLSLGYGEGSKGYFVQNGGTASIAGKLLFGYKGYGELTINDGTFTVGTQVIFSDNGADSSGNLVLNGGVLETPYVSCGNGKGGTITFNGGTLKAASPTKDRFIEAVSEIKVRIGEGGGTIDTAGLSINYSKDMQTADDVEKDGGLSIVGGGVLNVIGYSTSNRFAYKGKTRIELGTQVLLPSKSVGGGVTFVIPEDLAPGVYNPLTVKNSLTLEDLFNNAEFPDDPNAQFVLSSDKTKILCYYKLEGIQDPVWLGAASNDLGDGKNWSTGEVPQGGNCCISIGDKFITLTSSASFLPDSITFMKGSESITINGSDEISGITAITNLSSVRHVFNCAVSGDEIDFCNTSRCCDFRGGITVAKPVFINSPEDSNARAIVGNWIITNDWSPVPYNELGKNDGIGSSITVQGELLNPNNIIIYSGSVVTAATMKVTTSTYPAYLNNGRLVISGMIDISNTEADFKLARVDSDNATIIAGGIVYNTSSWAVLNAKALVLGADGISFNSTLNNNLNFTGTPTLYASGAATTLHAGKDDKQAYTIGNGKTLTVCTTRFDSTEPSTITIDGKVLGYYRRSYTGGMAVTGNGTLVFNSASTFTGALAVRDTATVKVNAACTPGTGEITLGAGTTLSLIATGSVFSPIANIVNIPTGEGEIATINLDGRSLRGGEQVICTLGELPEDCNVADHVTVTGTALRGRKCTVKVGEGNNLVVDIIPDGIRVIIR